MGCDLDNSPKGIAAGYQGVAVFSALLRVHGLLHLDGVLPPAYADPAYLARRIGAPIDWVREGIEACERVPAGKTEGLLRREPDGSLAITGWGEEWRPALSSTERVRRMRAKSHDVKHDETLCNETKRDETLRNDETLEKRREEKRREEKQNALSRWRAEALRIWDLQERLRRDTIPGARWLKPTDDRLERIAVLLDDGTASIGDCESVLRSQAESVKRDPGQARWFNGTTTWRRKNFDRNLAMDVAPAKPSVDPWDLVMASARKGEPQ